jgi:hypothetical protein
MDLENIAEHLQSIVAGAREIQSELDSGRDAAELYEALEGNGTTTDSDEIIQAVEFYAELEGNSTTDLDKISEALGVLSTLEHNGHDPDDVGDALDVYAIVENSSVCSSELEGSLELVEEWNQHCAHTWEDPASIANDYEALRNIVEVFSEAFGKSIDGVDDANEAVRLLGSKSSVSDEERALLDAISALCVKQAGTKTVPATWKLSKPVPAFGSAGINSESKE